MLSIISLEAINSLFINFSHIFSSYEGLTVAALSKHDDTDLDAEINSEKTISQSHASSAPISISGLTDCSNLTFEKVHKLWASPLEQHKQVCFTTEVLVNSHYVCMLHIYIAGYLFSCICMNKHTLTYN